MPHKLAFETDLINVNIRRKDHQRIRKYRRQNEPFYSILRRILDQSTDIADVEFMYNEQVEVTRNWMNRALKAEDEIKQLKEQRGLFQ